MSPKEPNCKLLSCWMLQYYWTNFGHSCFPDYNIRGAQKKSDKNFLAITDSATWFYCFQGVLWSLLQFWSSSAHEKGYWELFYIIERHLASCLLLCEITLVQLKPSFMLCICVLQFRFRHCYLKVPTKISNALVRWVCRSEVLNTKIAVRHVFGVPWTSTWCLVPFIM